MIFAIGAAWMAYKRANEHGRSGLSWAAITAGAFVGTQLVVGFIVGFMLQLGAVSLGWSENLVETYSILITIFAVIISIVVTVLILRYLNKVPDDGGFINPPEPLRFS